MAERPLLPLPRPEVTRPPAGHGGGGRLRLPPKDTQIGRFGPTFHRLRTIIERGEPLALRADPTSLAPDRVVVFEIGGTVSEFTRALSRVPGFELMAEYDTEASPDDLFAEEDTRKGREGQIRTDKVVAGRFYLAMPDVTALRQLVSLWERWDRGEQLGTGFTPFHHVFAQLRSLRPWSAEDRIPEDTIQYWREQLQRSPNRPVRTEVEFWFYRSLARRTAASQAIRGIVTAAGGAVVHEIEIPEIAYQGALIDIPAAELLALMERQEVSLALADEIMFLRPQSVLMSPLQLDAVEDGAAGERQGAPPDAQPIAALLDGVPLQGHALLGDRLIIEDPDGLESRALVPYRAHGTAMASLILHGDLNGGESSLDRPLYVRPVMYASDAGVERTDGDRLLIDTIYRAIIRIKGTPDQQGTAPSVFLVNVSLGDLRRPFTRIISPFARLLDFLSARYSVLFVVSAGNATGPLALSGFNTWDDFLAADAPARERAVLAALNDAKHERSILSPAESLNALTIGAHHADQVRDRPTIYTASDPFADDGLPNPSCALGLGYRRMIKPDLLLPGGREHIHIRTTGDGLTVRFAPPQRLYGLAAAAPDPSGRGRLNQTALSDGTSSATALATRAAHRIFTALMDRDGGSPFWEMPAEFYALAVKALLVHRARWSGKHELLKEICGPVDKRRYVERAENASRFMGFGIPNIAEALECASNRATLLGYGALRPDSAHRYRIPLPGSLERVTEPRALTVTLAWFSPIKAGHHDYRCVKLEAQADQPALSLGVTRESAQPADPSVKRGTVFHEVFTGARAVPFINDGHLWLSVWCKDETGGPTEAVRYAAAISIEAGPAIPVYQEIQQRLRIRPQSPIS